MQIHSLVIVALLLTSILGLAEDERTISIEGIFRADQIIGHLGKPLGTVLHVRGEVRFSPVPDENNPHPKGGTERFISVTHVNDVKLPKPVELEVFPTSPRSLAHGEIIMVRAYERLMTFGTPEGLPKRAIQARGKDLEFNLTCYLHIVDEEKTKAEQAGTGQPATRPESKSEGSDKPQPEAEGRSR